MIVILQILLNIGVYRDASSILSLIGTDSLLDLASESIDAKTRKFHLDDNAYHILRFTLHMKALCDPDWVDNLTL